MLIFSAPAFFAISKFFLLLLIICNVNIHGRDTYSVLYFWSWHKFFTVDFHGRDTSCVDTVYIYGLETHCVLYVYNHGRDTYSLLKIFMVVTYIMYCIYSWSWHKFCRYCIYIHGRDRYSVLYIFIVAVTKILYWIVNIFMVLAHILYLLYIFMAIV